MIIFNDKAFSEDEEKIVFQNGFAHKSRYRLDVNGVSNNALRRHSWAAPAALAILIYSSVPRSFLQRPAVFHSFKQLC